MQAWCVYTSDGAFEQALTFNGHVWAGEKDADEGGYVMNVMRAHTDVSDPVANGFVEVSEDGYPVAPEETLDSGNIISSCQV